MRQIQVVEWLMGHISKQLSVDYGTGFNRYALSHMINFHREFPDYEKAATMSQLFH